ncbi:MAG: S-methyl-5-thioribose-1-phosphate isomerase [Polyangiaceae bacterium]|nr:S-methyl-5-thioribose-1-phosphate isomerase [Polyangiaceae bacterium]
MPPELAPLSGTHYSAAELDAEDRRAFVLDQRLLPGEVAYQVVESASAMAEAIRAMVVRGAPAIGIAAAYGVALGARAAADLGPEAFVAALEAAAAELRATRPTAVNLAWAVERMLHAARTARELAGPERAARLAAVARELHREDVRACQRIGAAGAARLPDTCTVLTHCNAGALATGGFGTALGVVRAAVAAGKRVRVIADETRPYLQGARLTAWELAEDGIDVTVISDGMAAHCMARGLGDVVVVVADRIAANGDVANKIGTYGVACLARVHELPFYVAAPWSTFDLATPDGSAIVIEERSADELAVVGTRRIVPEGARVLHPAFDVTPARLVAAIFTETGEVAAEPGAIARAYAAR